VRIRRCDRVNHGFIHAQIHRTVSQSQLPAPSPASSGHRVIVSGVVRHVSNLTDEGPDLNSPGQDFYAFRVLRHTARAAGVRTCLHPACDRYDFATVLVWPALGASIEPLFGFSSG
jgi:hypothetical protein